MTDIDKFMANQDRLQGMMIEAYQGHKIPNWYVFKPYFDWKMRLRGCDFAKREIREMWNTAKSILNRYYDTYANASNAIDYDNQEDIFYLQRGYGKDAEIVGYMEAIEEELTNIMILRYD